MRPYIFLGIAALLPVITTIVLHFIGKLRFASRMNYWIKQLIIGIVFGGLAILGTEWGIQIEIAQVNARDGAVLTAGLIFGGPAGIIAGLIGGIERWISVAWGISSYTRVACTISTIVAGLISAWARKSLFENKRPGWIIAFVIGIVTEVFHLSMVFLTNMGDPEFAMAVVAACAPPMIIANATAIMLAALAMYFFDREKHKERKAPLISQTIQKHLLVAILIVFLFTTFFSYRLQTTMASKQSDSILQLSVESVTADIQEASDENILKKAYKVAEMIGVAEPAELAALYEIDELNLVDEAGFIVASTNKQFIGFNMSSGEQSAEFLVLLGTQKDYVQDYGPISYDPSSYRKYAGVRLNSGFIQIGYDSKRFHSDLKEQVKGITKNRHVGQTGYIFILDEQFRIVSAPEGFDGIDVDKTVLDPIKPGTTFNLVLEGENNLCRYMMTEGYYIVSVLPENEAMKMRNAAVYVNTFMEVLVFAILFVMVFTLVRGFVVNKIKKVNSSLERITEGDLNEVVNVQSSEEFVMLSEDINSTVDTLKRYIAEAAARIDKELEVAKNIQCSALPSEYPEREDFDIYATMFTAKEVGGDFYDFYLTDENTLHFLIADVSGKGIPAAMFMMRAKTELKSLTEDRLPLSDVFTRGNHALCEGNDAGMFVTAWQCGIDLQNGHVQFANAGHNPPLIRRKDGSFTYLKSRPGLVLAGMDGLRYKTQELDLAPGDIVFLYTDGVTEAQNTMKELYGEQRLLETINRAEFSSMEELCSCVKNDVDAFVGNAAQFDDITMVAFRYLGSQTKPSGTAEA